MFKDVLFMHQEDRFPTGASVFAKVSCLLVDRSRFSRLSGRDINYLLGDGPRVGLFYNLNAKRLVGD